MKISMIKLAGYQIRIAYFEPLVALNGHIVFLHGYAEFIEKHQPLYEFLQQEGYQIWTLDWPAQGLSQRFLNDDHQSYLQSIIDAPKILDHFLQYLHCQHGITKPHLIAHSMGAQSAIRYLQNKEFSFEFDQIILSAPFLGIHFMSPRWNFFVRQLLRVFVLAGGSKILLNPKSLMINKNNFERNKLTSNYDAWLRTKALLQDNPDLRSNHANYGWLYENLKFIDEIFQKKHDILPKMTVIKAGNEQVVSNASIDVFFQYQTQVKLIEIPSKHELLQDVSYKKVWQMIAKAIRLIMLTHDETSSCALFKGLHP